MPRTARIVTPGWPYHLVVRGNNRRRLCSYASDYRRLIDLVEKAAARVGCLLHVVCIMSNHVHFIVTPPTEAALSAFVRYFAQPFAQRRNRQRDGSGKLFEQRFFSKRIETDEQLAVCTAYIELNPVRAGVVQGPGDYLWSSYRLHACDPRPSAIPARAITPSAWYRSLGRDPGAQARAYREFVTLVAADGREPEHGPPEPAATAKRLERPDRTRAS